VDRREPGRCAGSRSRSRPRSIEEEGKESTIALEYARSRSLVEERARSAGGITRRRLSRGESGP